MSDEIVTMLEKRVGRRSFLRGSALAAAAIVGAAAVSPLIGNAQEQEKKPDETEKGPGKRGKPANDDKPGNDDKKNGGPAQDAESETKLDAEGREYRSCPQCGSNMYRQGRTWTCENCGYSYVE
jgi:hypothetical protein